MEKTNTPILFPYEQEEFWIRVRNIVKEEVAILKESKKNASSDTPGLTYKPLYKITEVCEIFEVTRPTIYEWIKHGKLKPYKVRSRLYFLWNDIQAMIHS